MDNNITAEQLLDKIAGSLGGKVIKITDENYLNPNVTYPMVIDSKKYLTASDIEKLEQKSFIGSLKE